MGDLMPRPIKLRYASRKMAAGMAEEMLTTWLAQDIGQDVPENNADGGGPQSAGSQDKLPVLNWSIRPQGRARAESTNP